MALRIRQALMAVGLFCLAAIAQAANLVPNGDFTLGNTGFGSDYAFGAFTSCGNTIESQYTVGTDPAFWNCSSLVPSVGDHTTGSGNMFIGNGGNTALRVWFTTAPITVTPNTNYFFEAWILNWSTTSVGTDAAQLTFRANGVDLLTASATGVDVWTPVSTTWNSGSATSVTLTLFNSTPTSTGNDFAVDDIFFGITSSILVPSTISIAGGATQQTQTGTAFPEPLAVLVRDQAGSPLPGVTVNYVVNPVGGAGAGLSSSSAITDGSGVARVNATANAIPGSYTVTATVAGVEQTLTFNLTNTAPAAPPQPVPAVDFRGLLAMMVALAIAGAYMLLRR